MLSLLTPSFAASASTSAAQPSAIQSAISPEALDAQAREIGRSLRCVVCQNQSIDESDAPLAADMRKIVRSRLEAGQSKAEIIAYMRQNYGDFVLLKPPVQQNTLLLWGLPFAALFMVLLWFFRPIRKVKTVTDSLVPELNDKILPASDKSKPQRAQSETRK